MKPHEYLYKEPIEEVECVICNYIMPIDESYEVMDSTYLCDPDMEARCLGEWNNREYVRSEFYD